MGQEPDGFEVVVKTAGGFSTVPWRESSGVMNGTIAVLEESDGARYLWYESRDYGLAFAVPEADVLSAVKAKSALNMAVDVEVMGSDGIRQQMCFVAPRGRIRKLFAALGHEL